MRSCASVTLQNGFAPSASGRQENPYELERSYMNISLEPPVLDGNAAAGLLQQIFAVEVTTARVTCAACESIQPLASLRLYGLPMGYILCCPRCHATLIRVAAHRQACWLDFRGVSRWCVSIE
jgi:hypothetical protein